MGVGAAADLRALAARAAKASSSAATMRICLCGASSGALVALAPGRLRRPAMQWAVDAAATPYFNATTVLPPHDRLRPRRPHHVEASHPTDAGCSERRQAARPRGRTRRWRSRDCARRGLGDRTPAAAAAAGNGTMAAAHAAAACPLRWRAEDARWLVGAGVLGATYCRRGGGGLRAPSAGSRAGDQRRRGGARAAAHRGRRPRLSAARGTSSTRRRVAAAAGPRPRGARLPRRRRRRRRP